jgi:hypothetical protein
LAIDRERFEEYQDELQSQLQGLSATEKFKALRSKLLGYIARNDPPPGDTERIRRLVRELFGEEMASYTDQIVERYEATQELVNEYYNDLGMDLSRDMPRVRAIEQAQRGELGRYYESTKEEIARRVSRGLAQRESPQEIARRITPVTDKAARYAQTIAQTSVKGHSRALKHEKARIAGVQYFEYAGIIRSTTRPFCRAMVGTTHHIDDIRKMRNGNREPVETYCGGWNCIHSLEPDPFANKSNPPLQRDRPEGYLREVSDYDQTMVIPRGSNYTKRFHRAVSERHFNQLHDQEAFLERCRNVKLTRPRLQHTKDSKGNDLSGVEEARQAVRHVLDAPARRYFEFYRGQSKTIFERDGMFVVSSERELKTLIDPVSYEEYERQQIQYFVPVD